MSIPENQIYTGYMYSYPHKTAYRHIEPLDLTKVKDVFMGKNNSLYIHIPFCQTKCGYCNLFSVTGKNERYFDRYVTALEDHARQLKTLDIPFHRLIIGGGTPLILDNPLLARVFDVSRTILGMDLQQTFISIETSPNETTQAKAEILKENHVNRVSIGVQSFIDIELEYLHRYHTADSIHHALKTLTALDFPIINIDIIYGIPSQTIASLLHSLKIAVSYEPQEIYLYPLYNRGDVIDKLGLKAKKHNLYWFAKDFLKVQGYTQLSMRRFSKTELAVYVSCGFENNIAIGAGGRSYIGNTHTCLPYSNIQNKCTRIIDDYIHNPHKLTLDFGYVLQKEEQKRRYLLKNLFTAYGLILSDYTKTFHTDVFTDFPILHSFVKERYAVMKEYRLVLTDLGLSYSDYLGPMFISDEVNAKMEAWDFDDDSSL